MFPRIKRPGRDADPLCFCGVQRDNLSLQIILHQSLVTNKFLTALTWSGGGCPLWTKAKLAWQPLVYTTLQILQFNRSSFSSLVHTNAPTLNAIRAEITGLMTDLYCQYYRHRHFSLSSNLEVYIACYRDKLRGTFASFSIALCQSRKWI